MLHVTNIYFSHFVESGKKVVQIQIFQKRSLFWSWLIFLVTHQQL